MRPPLRVGDEDVLALTDRHLRQVPRREELRERGGVWSGDLDLPLDRNVAQDGVVDEVPEVLDRVAEVARDVHVVVDGEALGSPPHGGMEVRRLPDLGSESEVCKLGHLPGP